MFRTSLAVAAAALQDRKGVTAAEYAILAVGIIVGLGVLVTAFGARIQAVFTQATGAI